jgi:hypothetical protein
VSLSYCDRFVPLDSISPPFKSLTVTHLYWSGTSPPASLLATWAVPRRLIVLLPVYWNTGKSVSWLSVTFLWLKLLKRIIVARFVVVEKSVEVFSYRKRQYVFNEHSAGFVRPCIVHIGLSAVLAPWVGFHRRASRFPTLRGRYSGSCCVNCSVYGFSTTSEERTGEYSQRCVETLDAPRTFPCRAVPCSLNSIIFLTHIKVVTNFLSEIFHYVLSR